MKPDDISVDIVDSNEQASEDEHPDDMSKLGTLDEIVILEQLRERFYLSKYYTFFGEVLVAVNPYKDLAIYDYKYQKKYGENNKCDVPHIYWTAQQAYTHLIDTPTDQCILVSGESGAGKTEATKQLVSHVVFMSAARMSTGSNDSDLDNLHKKIVDMNPLLETFGNASTLMNENSSRFGKFLELFFAADGLLSGANVRSYILEKSRVVSRGREERNFHIFYYILAGLSSEQKVDYCVEEPDSYRIMYDGSDFLPWSPTERDFYKQSFLETEELMRKVGFTEIDIATLIAILAAILNLANIRFEDDSDTDGVLIIDEYPLQVVSNLLSLDIEQLTTALISNSVFIRGEEVVSLKKKVQAEDGRDALAKALYTRMFEWVIGKINLHLQGNGNQCDSTIGILDMSGFERFPSNGFEQLCINSANERLQRFFNETIFMMELRDYENEGIDPTNVTFRDNQPVIDLLFKKHGGVFRIIDEESMFPQATDVSLVQKLDKYCSASEHFITHVRQTGAFIINHYAGERQHLREKLEHRICHLKGKFGTNRK